MNNKHKVIFKKRWKKGTPNCFVEYGIDADNNNGIFGVSSEIELDETDEFRIQGVVPLDKKEYYIRIWIAKLVFSIGTGEIEILLKKRWFFKLVFGMAGFLPLKTVGEYYEKNRAIMSDKK